MLSIRRYAASFLYKVEVMPACWKLSVDARLCKIQTDHAYELYNMTVSVRNVRYL